MRVRIRAASAGDASAIHDMILAIAAATDDIDKVRSTQADIAHHGFGPDPTFHVLLAETDDGIVGMSLWFSSFSTWRGEPGGYIQDFYVAPDERGSEVASLLIASTAGAVLDAGGTYLRLSVDAANGRAQRFYVKAGFRWSDAERVFVLDADTFAACASTAVRDG